MKLNEVVIRPQQHPGFNIEDFDVNNAEQIGTVENIPIFHFKGGPKDPTLDAYALQVDNKFVSILVGKWGTLNGSAFYIQRTVTLPEYRNKGLMTSLYIALYKQLNFKLVSDWEQSPETISVWKKISRILPVKVIDFNKKQTVDINTVPEKEVFGPDTLKYQNIRLMLEYEKIIWEGVEIPDVKSKIIKDTVNYTHLDNKGKYI